MQNTQKHPEGVLSRGRSLISLGLKCAVILSAAAGVFLSAKSDSAFMGGSRVFMYFTIQSNILIGLICLAGIFLMGRPGLIKKGWSILQFTGTIAITLTGVIYCFVLAPTLGRYAWIFQNVLTHVVVPTAAVGDFFLTGRPQYLPRSAVLYGIVPPFLYAVYAGIGYAAGWEFSKGVRYPYFFLNWGSPLGAFGFGKELPLMGCVWWIIAILLFLIVLGWGYLKLLRVFHKDASAKP